VPLFRSSERLVLSDDAAHDELSGMLALFKQQRSKKILVDECGSTSGKVV
jgi:hypothetical protein